MTIPDVTDTPAVPAPVTAGDAAQHSAAPRPGRQRHQVTMEEALTPVRAWLLADAASRAERMIATATADAEHAVAEATASAEVVLDRARADGEADGRMLAATVIGRTRREARALVLHARLEAYEELRRAAIAEISARLSTPTYRAAVVAAVRAALGPDVSLAAGRDGRVVGVAPGGRTIEVTAASLVDAALSRPGAVDLADDRVAHDPD